MYFVRSTKAYRKAYKRMLQHKDFDQQVLDVAIDTLVTGGKLANKYRDHQLSGELKEYRECHIGNDMLLMYQKHERVLVLVLVDLGSHDSLFR